MIALRVRRFWLIRPCSPGVPLIGAPAVQYRRSGLLRPALVMIGHLHNERSSAKVVMIVNSHETEHACLRRRSLTSRVEKWCYPDPSMYAWSKMEAAPN